MVPRLQMDVADGSILSTEVEMEEKKLKKKALSKERWALKTFNPRGPKGGKDVHRFLWAEDSEEEEEEQEEDVSAEETQVGENLKVFVGNIRWSKVPTRPDGHRRGPRATRHPLKKHAFASACLCSTC
ncbi:unnamed protein product [Durusdinium trenchii]|uniref:Uncharacterized protein n=1 Tax=Durusdinium trenchii TaxID=1381693 RepID=A0ABP0NU38_9DINO